MIVECQISPSKKKLLKALIESNINIAMLIDFILDNMEENQVNDEEDDDIQMMLLHILMELRNTYPHLINIQQDSNLYYEDAKHTNALRLLNALTGNY